MLRHLAALLDEHPDGVDVHLEDAAVRLGLGMKGGASSPFLRSLGRLAQFRLSQPLGPDALQVRRRLPTLTRSQITRLPPGLRDEHDAWQHEASAEPTPEQRRTRARRLALSLLELGEDPEAVEQQLHRWQIHPALAHESLRWAQLRRGLPHANARPIPPPPPADHHADDPSHPTSPAAVAASFQGTIVPPDPDPVPVPPRPAA